MVKKKCGPGPNSAQMGNLHKRKELSNHQICSAILSTVKPLQYFRRNASEHFRELQKILKNCRRYFLLCAGFWCTQTPHLSAFLMPCSHEKAGNKGPEPMLTVPDWKSQCTDRHKY